MIINFKGRVLTVFDAPAEGDAFRYSPNYDRWVDVILNKSNDFSVAPQVSPKVVHSPWPPGRCLEPPKINLDGGLFPCGARDFKQ